MTGLVRAMMLSPGEGLSELQSGRLADFFGNEDPRLQYLCRIAVQSFRSEGDPENYLAFARLMYRLAPGLRSVFLGGREYSGLRELGEALLNEAVNVSIDRYAAGESLRTAKPSPFINEAALLLQHGILEMYAGEVIFDSRAFGILEGIRTRRDREDSSGSLLEQAYMLGYAFSSVRMLALRGAVFKDPRDLRNRLPEYCRYNVISREQFIRETCDDLRFFSRSLPERDTPEIAGIFLDILGSVPEEAGDDEGENPGAAAPAKRFSLKKKPLPPKEPPEPRFQDDGDSVFEEDDFFESASEESLPISPVPDGEEIPAAPEPQPQKEPEPRFQDDEYSVFDDDVIYVRTPEGFRPVSPDPDREEIPAAPEDTAEEIMISDEDVWVQKPRPLKKLFIMGAFLIGALLIFFLMKQPLYAYSLCLRLSDAPGICRGIVSALPETQNLSDLMKSDAGGYLPEPGDPVFFGQYPETDRTPEPLKWRVLKREGEKFLLITENCIDSRPFHDSFAQVIWENSAIRKWLNGEFLRQTFSEADRRLIASVKSPGRSGGDRVFLLDAAEAEAYFPDDAARRCRITSYAGEKGSRSADGFGDWWLSGSGKPGKQPEEQTRAPRHYSGVVRSDGTYNNVQNVDAGGITARPAMWVTLEKRQPAK
ncbi:DUF6273 domain-containing protein [Succinimonas sp.]|uniref:DUF6273 domain-containing protein n=1 Tax=Succinimonas sp. TaxID=1936151 RepID=UPI0038693663